MQLHLGVIHTYVHIYISKKEAPCSFTKLSKIETSFTHTVLPMKLGHQNL